MYGYVYITTNKINNKIYIGQHKWDRDTIDTTYFGSGKLLLEAIEKYGKDNFTCEILEWCESQEELNQKEIFYIDLFQSLTTNENYNISSGGFVPRLCGELNGNFGSHRRHSEEERQQISKSLKKYYETHEGYWTGKQLSEETKTKKSQAMSEYNHLYRNYEKVSKQHSGSKMMTNGSEQRWVYKDDIDDMLSQGWYFGICKKRKLKGKMVYVHKNNEVHRIFETELENYLANGFKRGKKD